MKMWAGAMIPFTSTVTQGVTSRTHSWGITSEMEEPKSVRGFLRITARVFSDEQSPLHSPVGTVQTLCWCGRSALGGSGAGKGRAMPPVRRREPCPLRRAAGRSGGRHSWPSGGTSSSRTWQALDCWWRRYSRGGSTSTCYFGCPAIYPFSVWCLFPSGGNSKWKENNTFPEAQCSLGRDGVLCWGALSESTAAGLLLLKDFHTSNRSYSYILVSPS